MKEKLTKLIIIIFFILIFIKKDIMYLTIYNTTLIWFKNIVPNLFPLFIISSLIINSNLIINICNIIGKPFKYIFKTSIYSSFVFILSLITGCPSNAKIIKDLLDNKFISINEANKILLFTTNYNPLLIISLLNNYLSKTSSIKILISIIATNIFIGLLNRNINIVNLNTKYIKKDINISNIIKTTIDTLIMILGTLIFFNLIINLLPIKNLLLKNIVNGFLEITTSLSSLQYLNINIKLKEILSLIYLSFGGLSIHMQIKSILPDTNYKLYLKNKLIYIPISLLIYLILNIAS